MKEYCDKNALFVRANGHSDRNVGNLDARVCPHHAGPRDFWRLLL